MSARSQRIAELCAARDRLTGELARLGAVDRTPADTDRGYAAWCASPAGAMALAEMHDLYQDIPQDPLNVIARRRRAMQTEPTTHRERAAS